jgi:hypothetical protein
LFISIGNDLHHVLHTQAKVSDMEKIAQKKARALERCATALF